jgi:hypothetical protein
MPCWCRDEMIDTSAHRVRGQGRRCASDVCERCRPQCYARWNDANERVVMSQRAGELTLGFGDDTNQAAQFALSVADSCSRGGSPT